MGQYQDDGVILKAKTYREADALVTVFGLNAGKVAAVAKGVRRPKSRLAAGLHPLAYSHLTLYRGRGDLETVVQADLGDGFGGLRNDLVRMGWGMVLADLVDELFSVHDASPEAFYLLVAGLQALSDRHDADTSGLTTSWQMLRAAGFGIHCHLCGRCQGSLEQGGIFQRESGLVLCQACGRSAGGLVLSPGTLRTLELWLKTVPERIGGTPVRGQVRSEMLRWFEAAVTGQIGRTPRALKFLYHVLDGEGEGTRQ